MKLITSKIFLIGLFFLLPFGHAQAAGVDEIIRKISNQIMVGIYRELLTLKDRYPELSEFDEKCFYENSQGIYALVYERKSPPGEKNPYAFGLTIESLDSHTFPEQEEGFNFLFPVLGVKFSGYQPKHILRGQFDLQSVINRHGIRLSLEEQKYLPLHLEIRPTKAVFKVNEPIEFDVILTNVGKINRFVKKLDFSTLHFIIDDKPWGGALDRNMSGGERIALTKGESIRSHFQGESSSRPAEIQVQAAYRVMVNDVNPFASVKIKVVE